MAVTYKLTRTNIILRETTINGVTNISRIPMLEESSDYQEYLKWVSDGGTPLPADQAAPIYNLFTEISGTVLTTDATPTELFRATLQPGRGYVADYQVMAIQNGSPYNMLYGRWMQGAKRVSTTAALVGVQTDVIPAQGDAAATGLKVSPSVSGGNFILSVVGLAGVQIRWIMRGSFITGSPVDLS